MKNKYGQVYITITCRDCDKSYMKRRDSLKSWSGRCKKCSNKEVSNRPEIIEIKREVGKRVMAMVGKLPHYPHNYRSGPANNKWRGGITPEVIRVRQSLEMKRWRISVFERDGFVCQICEKRGGDMHADHIKPFSLFPELRFDIDNGRTLCVTCHRSYGALVSNGVITREAKFKISDGTNWRIG